MNKLLLHKKGRPIFSYLFSPIILIASTAYWIHILSKIPDTISTIFSQHTPLSAKILFVLWILIDLFCIGLIIQQINAFSLTCKTYITIYEDHIEGRAYLRPKTRWRFSEKFVEFNVPREDCEVFYFNRKIWIKYDNVTAFLKYSIYTADEILTVLDM